MVTKLLSGKPVSKTVVLTPHPVSCFPGNSEAERAREEGREEKGESGREEKRESGRDEM